MSNQAPTPDHERHERVFKNAVLDLLDDYVQALDADRLEEWPNFFVKNGRYRILSKENVSLGLPAPLTYYYSQAGMRDRVRALREALTYEPVSCRHIVSAPRLVLCNLGEIAAGSNFAIYQSTEEGVSWLFGVGRYEDVIVMEDGCAKFRSREVILDTFGIRNLISVPL